MQKSRGCNSVSQTDGRLVASLKEHGLQTSLKVRPRSDGKYEVICGRERFLDAPKAGLTELPCMVQEMTDREAMEAMLTENLDREGLTDYEKGRWLKTLMDKFPDEYPNQEAVGKKFHLSQQTVSTLIAHYELLANQPNITTRVVMLPERVTREIRRATLHHVE